MLFTLLYYCLGSRKDSERSMRALIVAAWVTLTLLTAAYTVYGFNLQSPFLSTLYSEDSIFEYLTAITAIEAAAMMLASLLRGEGRFAWFCKIGFTFCFFFFGMEEISWGQRLLGVETPSILVALNYQDEFNLHNIFNPFFTSLYFIFNLLAATLCFLGAYHRDRCLNWFGLSDYRYLIVPDLMKVLAAFFVLLPLQSFIWRGELTEEILAFSGGFFALSQLLLKRIRSV